MAEKHDSAYRLLFSHRPMVEDLLRAYGGGDWIQGLDFSTLEKAPEVEISDRLTRREKDLVWRLRHRLGWIYIYLLFEFQSRNEPWMALRLMTYLGLFYEGLLRAGQIKRGETLPPVVPLVIYNGSRPWTAPTDVAELITPGPDGCDDYRPRLRYLLIDEHRASPSPTRGNLASILFDLERSSGAGQLRRHALRLVERLKAIADPRLSRTFLAFLQHSLLPARYPDAEIPALTDLQEVRNMLRETVAQWPAQWLREGREQGLKQGLKQGQSQLLIDLIESRFGDVDEVSRRRIAAADSGQLRRWARRILTATSLAETLDGE